MDPLFHASIELGINSHLDFFLILSQDDWNEEMIYSNSTVWKFNHYAYLSQADVSRKAQANKNPFLTFNSQVDEFFSRVKDVEVHHYVPEVRRRMLRTIQKHPPTHPDDWKPDNGEI